MIEKKLIKQAVETLREITKKYYEDSSKKKPLLEDEKESALFLQVTLKKIPYNRTIKMIKMNLPHPLVKDSCEVCLIMGDQDKKDHKAEIAPDILHYKQLLEEHNVTCVSEIVTLRQLRTEYKPYEAKQKLLAAYDVFLTDKKIAECLPRVLGKHFFKKRKFPIQVDMKSPTLKNHIEKAIATKVFHITGHGNSCCSEIAYLDMKNSEIQQNVLAAAKALSEEMGSLDNIMGIYLKTSKSKAIPIYMSYDFSCKINLKKREKEVPIIDELSTYPIDVKVKVFKNGNVYPIFCKRKNVTEEDLLEHVFQPTKESNECSESQETCEPESKDISLILDTKSDESVKQVNKGKQKIKKEIKLEAETKPCKKESINATNAEANKSNSNKKVKKEEKNKAETKSDNTESFDECSEDEIGKKALELISEQCTEEIDTKSDESVKKWKQKIKKEIKLEAETKPGKKESINATSKSDKCSDNEIKKEKLEYMSEDYNIGKGAETNELGKEKKCKRNKVKIEVETGSSEVKQTRANTKFKRKPTLKDSFLQAGDQAKNFQKVKVLKRKRNEDESALDHVEMPLQKKKKSEEINIKMVKAKIAFGKRKKRQSSMHKM